MPVEVIFPKVDMDMESGVLSEWLCANGDTIDEGQPIFVIETDKSAMEIEAAASGRISIGQSVAGTEHPVGKVLAHIYKPDEVFGASVDGGAQTKLERNGVARAEAMEAQSRQAESRKAGGSGTDLRVKPFEVRSVDAAEAAVSRVRTRVRASPAARRVAAEYNIPLSEVVGTARKGRIVRADVLAVAGGLHSSEVKPVRVSGGPVSGVPFASAQVSATTGMDNTRHDAANQTHHRASGGVAVSNQASESNQTSVTHGVTRVPHSQMRRTIATRLTHAVQTIPAYQIAVDCCCQSLMATSAELNDSLAAGLQQSEFDHKVSLNTFFVRALALTLADIGAANCQWAENEILVFDSVAIGVAVAVEGGLITPVIQSVEDKSLLQIAAEAQSLITRAKSGELGKSEYQGGVTTVSNLGMYGVPEFTSIINPPQSSIVSVGAVEQRAVAVDDQIKIKPMCRVTFTFDHRVIDGAVGARVASTFKAYIERSVRLLL